MQTRCAAFLHALLDPRCLNKAMQREVSPQKNFYEKTGVVIMRCGGTKVIKIATIYDWKDFKLGHKAEKLAVTLQALLNKAVEKTKKDKPPENKAFFGESVDLG